MMNKSWRIAYSNKWRYLQSSGGGIVLNTMSIEENAFNDDTTNSLPKKRDFKLQLELLSRWFIDLFNAGNLLLSSILLWLHSSVRYHQRYFRFSTPHNFSPTTIRASFQVVSRPIWCEESADAVHFALSLLVGVPSSKTFPIFSSWRFFRSHEMMP